MDGALSQDEINALLSGMDSSDDDGAEAVGEGSNGGAGGAVQSMEEAMEEVHMVVEGVYSAKAAKGLSEKYQVPMPIIEEVNRILFEGEPVREAVQGLMLRDKKAEHEKLWEDA